MPYYFMRDTPLQALEQLMMSQPGQKPRGGGIYRSPFHYTLKDVACEYCQNYDRKHPCRLCECTCLEERIEAGVPASYTCFIAAIRRSMLEAESISFLKFSSSVLIDHETVTRPSFFSRSISRTTRSDFVQIRISASLPINCSRSFLVFPNCSSCGL